MLFKIGDTVHFPMEVPCAIIFADDEEKKRFIEVLQNMPPKENVERWFAYNKKDYFTPETFDKWATLSEEDAKKMTRITNKPPSIEL